MKLFEGKNLFLGIIAIVSVVVILLLITFSIISIASDSLFRKKIESKSNTIRIFVLDIKNDKVNYFNSSKLRGRKSSSITTFYSQFSTRDREKLISWIGDLLDENEDVKNFIEVSTFVKRSKKIFNSLLEVQKIDYEKQIIYLESHLLDQNVNVIKKGKQVTFSSKEAFKRSVHFHNAHGFSLCVNFFNKTNKTDDIDHLAYLELRNIVSQFKNENIIMFEATGTKILIANYEIENKIQALDFIEELKNKLNAYLTIESIADEIAFSISASENQYFYRDIRNLIDSLKGLADYAKDNDLEQMFFDENNKNLSSDSTFKTEVENIIEKGKIQYLYQALVDAEKTRIIGYFTYLRPVDSVFKNIEELKNFAVRTDDDQQLFTTIVKNSVANFISEKLINTTKLLLPITVNETQYVTRTLTHVVDISDANIVLVLQEQDITTVLENEFGLDTFSDTIKAFKSKGFEVAIQIDDDILNLPPSLYALCDYFILSVDNHLKDNPTTNIPVFKGLIEKLLRYQKPMIAIDIPTWNVVELVYKFGINLLSSDVIAAKNEHLLPLEKKIYSKIKKLEE